jgi:hypothetical protein
LGAAPAPNAVANAPTPGGKPAPSPSAPSPQTAAAYAPSQSGPSILSAIFGSPQSREPIEASRPDAVKPPDATIVPRGPSGSGEKGSPVFVRVFKKEGVLELYVRSGGRYTLKKSFPICKYSGKLGPKLKNADYQAPEGFYAVTSRQLNPNSQYHLAFNIGYPNAFDRQLGRTGSAIMVHGDCVSIGCFAMTNKGIEEIYGWVAAALKGGQREVPVHVFPFRMSSSAIARETNGGGFASLMGADPVPGGGTAQWRDFWTNLKEGHDIFERTGEPPTAYACRGRYAFGAGGAGCQRIAGW